MLLSFMTILKYWSSEDMQTCGATNRFLDGVELVFTHLLYCTLCRYPGSTSNSAVDWYRKDIFTAHEAMSS